MQNVHHASRHRISALAIALLVLAGPALAQDQVFIFGDSLADPGNVFAVTGQVASAPYEPVPAAPYDLRDGARFTNGRTWPEYLAGHLGLGADSGPALGNQLQAANYAFGGARATPYASPFSAVEQIYLMLSQHGSYASAEALYVLQFGGNDVRAALAELQSTGEPQAAVNVVALAAQAMADNIGLLYAAGAREFVVANSPNLGVVPAVPVAARPLAAWLSQTYNLYLESRLAGLETQFGDIRITRIDFYGLLDRVIANPGDHGLTDVATPCLTFFTRVDAVCTDPNKRLFWDGIHPTTAGHRIIAEEALAALAR